MGRRIDAPLSLSQLTSPDRPILPPPPGPGQENPMSPPPPRPPPALLDELVEEVLLRFPPEEPASLVRAALVCKRWCRLVSGRRFRRRFREFHRTPPVLDFICNVYEMAHFVPASSSCPPFADQLDCLALDARHGRVLLLDMGSERETDLYVWDPVKEERWELPAAPLHNCGGLWRQSAAVLCAATGPCDHLDCPFLVILLHKNTGSNDLSVCVYSSESGSWSKLPYAALVGNALYFLIFRKMSILEYDLATHEMFEIDKPPEACGNSTVLITTEDGGLGLAIASRDGQGLTLWSMEARPEGDVKWAQTRVIDLEKMIPFGDFWSPQLVGFAHGVGALFLCNDGGLFSINLKSDQVRRLSDDVLGEIEIDSGVPYMSFYTPVLGAAFTCEGPGVGDSSP